MKKILLIKLSSLGDLFHVLPALSDARLAYPDCVFDWVIDENFHEVALWHPAVKRIFMTNHRVWKRELFSFNTWRSMASLAADMRSSIYDLIIDGQGNFKSATLSCLARGPRAGFDQHSVREWIAHWAYQRKFPAPKNSHAIDRLRRLFASALEYPLPLSPPDFQIDRSKFISPDFFLPKDYCLFIHNASWKTKLWPEAHWVELIRRTVADGFSVLLPWGNNEEKQRAQRLAVDKNVHVLPKLSLSEVGFVLERARACVAMDTGLSHFSAALDVPCVTLYGSTHSGLIGASGSNQVHLMSTLACSPCEKKSCRFNETENPCLKEITSARVYKELQQIVSRGRVNRE